MVIMKIQEKFDLICKSISTWALSDGIGLDTETSYAMQIKMSLWRKNKKC